MTRPKITMHKGYSDPEYTVDETGCRLFLQVTVIIIFSIMATAVFSWVVYSLLGVDTSGLEAKGSAYVAGYGIQTSSMAISWLAWIIIFCLIVWAMSRFVFWIGLDDDDDDIEEF